MADKSKDAKNDPQRSVSKGLLSPPGSVQRLHGDNRHTTRDAMDELLDETFNSESLDEGLSLVGLDDVDGEDTGDAPVLAGPTSPEAQARRYKKLREDHSFWDELERNEEDG